MFFILNEELTKKRVDIDKLIERSKLHNENYKCCVYDIFQQVFYMSVFLSIFCVFLFVERKEM